MNPPSYWKIASRQFWPFFTTIFLLIAAGVFVAGLVILNKELQYETGGATVVGRVTNKYSERRGSGKSRRTHYLLQYQFTSEDGYNMDAEDSVDYDLWENYQRGDAISIQYLRSNPRTNRVAGETEKTAGTVMGSLGGAGTLLVGFFFLRSWKRVGLTRRLWEEGRRVDGAVTDVHATNFRVNRVQQWKIRYTYRDYAGREHHGESDYLPPGEATDWAVGDACVVLCDKDQPEISTWAGRSTQ